MYSGKRYNLTDQEWNVADRVIGNDLNAKFIEMHGMKLAINDIRYAGHVDSAPEAKQKYFVPAEQKALEDSPHVDVVGYLKTGEMKGQKGNVAKFLREEWKKHVEQRPQLDIENRKKYLEAHEKWMKHADLDENDPRRKPKFIYAT